MVVDDHQGWRKYIRLLLLMQPEWQVICEASDGPEAIQKAEELRPNLILLDIGLPTLNGLEAARRIRQLSPNSKIVFLSTENSPEVVQVALDTGAPGYVYKADAQSELLPAVDAVLRGRQFVSSTLRDQKFTNPLEKRVPPCHEVLFYSNDSVLLDGLTRFIAAALKGGNAAIVLATQSHRDGLLQRLKTECVDIDGALQQGVLISLDARETLSTIMVNGMPDSLRFFRGIGSLIETASKAARAAQPEVAVFGEAVALLQAEGKVDAAIRFEQLGNFLAKTHEVNILCAYPLSGLHRKEDQLVFHRICAEHSAVSSR